MQLGRQNCPASPEDCQELLLPAPPALLRCQRAGLLLLLLLSCHGLQTRARLDQLVGNCDPMLLALTALPPVEGRQSLFAVRQRMQHWQAPQHATGRLSTSTAPNPQPLVPPPPPPPRCSMQSAAALHPSTCGCQAALQPASVLQAAQGCDRLMSAGPQLPCRRHSAVAARQHAQLAAAADACVWLLLMTGQLHLLSSPPKLRPPLPAPPTAAPRPLLAAVLPSAAWQAAAGMALPCGVTRRAARCWSAAAALRSTQQTVYSTSSESLCRAIAEPAATMVKLVIWRAVRAALINPGNSSRRLAADFQ